MKFQPKGAAALAICMIGSSAGAEVYHYDVTMSLTQLGAYVDGIGDGEPEILPVGVDCEVDTYQGVTDHYCEGYIDLIATPIDHPFITYFTDTISAELTLDSTYDPYDGLTPNRPQCAGSIVICEAFDFSRNIGYAASATGFRSGVGGAYGSLVQVDETGLYHVMDADMSAVLGNTYYSFPANGPVANYETTSLTITELGNPAIAPVPLPAGGVLLGSALMLLGWRRRGSPRQR